MAALCHKSFQPPEGVWPPGRLSVEDDAYVYDAPRLPPLALDHEYVPPEPYQVLDALVEDRMSIARSPHADSNGSTWV